MKNSEDLSYARFFEGCFRESCCVDDVSSLVEAFEVCRIQGAAVVCGLIGMGEAIRTADLKRWARLNGWTWSEAAACWEQE